MGPWYFHCMGFIKFLYLLKAAPVRIHTPFWASQCIGPLRPSQWRIETICTVGQRKKVTAVTFFRSPTVIWAIEPSHHWFRQWFIAHSTPSFYRNQYRRFVNRPLADKIREFRSRQFNAQRYMSDSKSFKLSSIPIINIESITIKSFCVEIARQC